MPVYLYTARTRTGEKTGGEVEAPDRRLALLQIERLGHIPVTVTDRGSVAAASTSEQRPWITWRRGPSRLNLRAMLLFATELNDLLASGMKLGHALNALASRQTGKAGSAIVADLRDQILRGASLSDALARHPRSFPDLFVSIVRAGEASGALQSSLAHLAHHYERVQETREKILMALIYPMIVLAMGIGTLIFSMVYVVPNFQEVFDQMDAALPLPTRMLLGLSGWTLHYGPILLAVTVIGCVLASRAFKTPAGRLWRDGFLLKLPLVKGVVAAGILANFARTLETLMANGVRVVQALDIVRQTVGNAVIAREIGHARERVTDGATISGPLAASKAIPPMLTDMLSVGEQTGDMCGALRHIARRYENELERSLKIFITALEPLLIVVVAVIVGFIAIAILMAVFSLSTGLSA